MHGVCFAYREGRDASLLDPRAARHLERSLAAVLDGRTVIAIAHRLHTAHDADLVVVMDGGRIIERGTHDDLVHRGGAYAALWSRGTAMPGAPDRSATATSARRAAATSA